MHALFCVEGIHARHWLLQLARLSPSRQKAASVAGLKRALLLRRELFFASFFFIGSSGAWLHGQIIGL